MSDENDRRSFGLPKQQDLEKPLLRQFKRGIN